MVGTAADAPAPSSRALHRTFTHSLQGRNRSLTPCEDSSLRMRRLLVLATLAALATGAAETAFAQAPVLLRTPGSEFVELKGGNGRAVVTGRGSLAVSMRRGTLRIVDLPQRGRPHLSSECRQRARRVSRTTLQLRGRTIGCLIWSGETGGRWQAVMRGRGISASGRVKGSLTLDAVDTGRTGRFRIGVRSLRRWPRAVQTYVLDRE
jgi:hypothetical protein